MLRHSIFLTVLGLTSSAAFAVEEPQIKEVIVEPAEIVLTDADQSV